MVGCSLAMTSMGAGAFAIAAGHMPLWVPGSLITAGLCVVAVGVACQTSGVFACPLLRVQTERSEVAITFDDGPDPRFTPALLETLDKHGHLATFFVIGERAETHPELLVDVVRRGHGLGNHSWHHSYVTNLMHPSSLAADLVRTNELIAAATGRAPRWFRTPVGLLSPRVTEAARLAGLDIVAWTASARDGVAWRSVDDAMRRLKPYLHPGAILVLHDGVMDGRSESIAQPLLERLLDELQTRGLRSVTLDQMLEAPPSTATLDAPPA
jgi:peptidoglycan/xylan/chitin deacetylase (PgdA/CDA1 family)